MTREQRIERYDRAAKKLREAFIKSLDDEEGARDSKAPLNRR